MGAHPCARAPLPRGPREQEWNQAGVAPCPLHASRAGPPPPPQVAPKTVELVISLLESGSYNTNHFFRVDKGFVAQAAGVVGGRTAKLDQRQQVGTGGLGGDAAARGPRALTGRHALRAHVSAVGACRPAAPVQSLPPPAPQPNSHAPPCRAWQRRRSPWKFARTSSTTSAASCRSRAMPTRTLAARRSPCCWARRRTST